MEHLFYALSSIVHCIVMFCKSKLELHFENDQNDTNTNKHYITHAKLYFQMKST